MSNTLQMQYTKRKFQIGDTAVVNSNVSTYDIKHSNVGPGVEVIIKAHEISYGGSDIYTVQNPIGKLIKLYSNQLDKTSAKTSIEMQYTKTIKPKPR